MVHLARTVIAPAQGRHAQRQINRGAAQRVARGQKGGQGGGLFARTQEHMRQTRVQRQVCDGAAMGSNPVIAIQRAKGHKQAPRLG